MTQAYIVDALRTAGARRGGALRDWHPADRRAKAGGFGGILSRCCACRHRAGARAPQKRANRAR